MRKQISGFAHAIVCLILVCSGAVAQTARPTEQNKREANLVELITLDVTIKLDIRYATSDNFVGRSTRRPVLSSKSRPQRRLRACIGN
jgi:D-alanyl-D-alanine dipeptidase